MKRSKNDHKTPEDSRFAKQTGIGNLDVKQKMLQKQFEACIENFHNPLAFMAQAESLILGVRHYTFTIQANKDEIPDFENWYSPWVGWMKNDAYMTWIANTRTPLVHKDILATRSNSTLTIHNDHAQTLINKKFDVLETTETLINEAVILAEKNPSLRHATGIIERHYIFDLDGQDEPALNILSAAVGFLTVLHSDLADYIENRHSKNLTNLPGLRGRFVFPTDKLALTFKLRTGNPVEEKVIRIHRDEEAIEQARAIYGDFKPIMKKSGDAALDELRFQFEVVSHIFNIDGYLLPILHYHLEQTDEWRGLTVEYHDRAEKILFWRKNCGKSRA